MVYPHRLEVDAPTESAATAGSNTGASPLVRRAIIEAGLSSSMTSLPAERLTLAPYGFPRPASGSGLPDALAATPGTLTTGDRDVDLVRALGAVRGSAGAAFVLGELSSFRPVTVRGYALSALPLGAVAWFPLTVNPTTGAPWSTSIGPVLWCRGTVKGTPDRVTVRNLDVNTTALCVLLPSEVNAFGSAATLTATADAADGSPVRFTGPDGFPIDSDGNAFEVGTLSLNDIAPGGAYGSRTLAVFDGSARTAKVLRPQ